MVSYGNKKAKQLTEIELAKPGSKRWSCIRDSYLHTVNWDFLPVLRVVGTAGVLTAINALAAILFRTILSRV